MPTRIPRATSRALRQLAQASRQPTSCLAPVSRTLSTTSSRQYATAAAVPRPAGLQLAADYVPPTKPASARPPETRKSQLIRTYTSLLRTSPLILFFQHNNITALEWAGIRRELRAALRAVQVHGAPADITSDIQLSVLRTRMFNVALKLVSFYDASAAAKAHSAKTTPTRGPLVHDLSEAAYEAMKTVKVPEDSAFAQLEPLLVGPVAALVLPAVSPQHLAAALKVLAPGPVGTPYAPPTRRKNPSYYEADCQNGLSKLLLVGGRIEGSVFDVDGVRWVGGIENGLEGLRAQLVAMLQSAGLGLTGALEANSKNLWLSLESRRSVLEEEQGGKKDEKTEEKAEDKPESS